MSQVTRNVRIGEPSDRYSGDLRGRRRGVAFARDRTEHPLPSPTDLVGFLGFATSSAIFVPQAIKAWNGRRDPETLRGISVGTQVTAAVNAAIWLAYAILAHAWWSGAPSLVNLPLSLAILWWARSSRVHTPDITTTVEKGELVPEIDLTPETDLQPV